MVVCFAVTVQFDSRKKWAWLSLSCREAKIFTGCSLLLLLINYYTMLSHFIKLCYMTQLTPRRWLKADGGSSFYLCRQLELNIIELYY